MSIFRFIFRVISKILAKGNIYLIRSLSFYEIELPLPPNFDYVRYATLSLCFKEIEKKNIAGNVAEVGVYKGDFAKKLNHLFSTRKLYLFDTFSGFDEQDLEKDRKSGFSKSEQTFSDTSIEKVLQRMPFPQLCEIRAGHFPESAKGLEDSFCFVSIDVDLYEPCVEAIKYFLPRMAKGGYIMVHDYHNTEYKGIRAAIHELSASLNFNYTPLPDNCGSIMIAI